MKNLLTLLAILTLAFFALKSVAAELPTTATKAKTARIVRFSHRQLHTTHAHKMKSGRKLYCSGHR